MLFANAQESGTSLGLDSTKSLTQHILPAYESGQNAQTPQDLQLNSLNLARNSANEGILLAELKGTQNSPNSSPKILLADATPQSSNLAAQDSQDEGIRTYQLDEVNINSVGDDISESGISEGILNKGVASGPLDNKRVIDMPFQVNTISRELMDNQSVQDLYEAIKYFPSVQLQYRGGPGIALPKTRGIGQQGNQPDAAGIGYVFWDGFYVTAPTAVPMNMFDSMQVQNGPAGSIYGLSQPVGVFNFSRKRPLKDYNAVWFDFISRGNLGVGLDTSNKFKYMGYRAVLFTTNGEKERANNELQTQLAYLTLDFYPLENLVFETSFSSYRYITSGQYYRVSAINKNGTFSGVNVNGVTESDIPSVLRVPIDADEGFMENFAASAKFKYMPLNNELLYLEGGYQFQRVFRNRDRYYGGFNGFDAPSAFIKAQSEFNTGFIRHNIALSANGFQWINNRTNVKVADMKNLGLLYDISLGEYFELIVSGSNSWFKNNANYKDSGLSWSGSAIVKAIPGHLNVYFSYSDGLKVGTAQYYDPTATSSGGGRTYPEGHPLLGQTIVFDPYRTYQFELGLKARVAEIDFSAAVFQITRPIYYSVNDANGYAIFDKQGEQRNRGLEFTTGGQIIEPLSVYGGFTLLDARMNKSAYKDAEGKKIIGEPLWQANVLFDFAVPYINKLAFTTNLHYTDKRYVDEMNTKAVDGYFTMDLGVRYATKEWVGKETTIRLNINNLFNAKYWVGMHSGSLDGNLGTNSSNTNLYRSYDRSIILSGQVKF